MSGWRTKRDIIRDLTTVTNGIADVDIDDSYIVIGNEKPKQRIEDEFYDEDPRFEGVDLNHESGRTPDLDGIKKMLQMYNEYEEMKERERGVDASGGDAAPYVISKLNPLSAPFQPRGPAAEGPFQPKGPAAEAERRARERELRHAIDQASLDNSRKGRTQKNVAIASLLKLHSTGSSGPRQPSPAHSSSDHIKDHAPPPASAEDESVKESIEKVNSWLDAGRPTVASPTPPTPPTPDSSVVMFKKKQTNQPTKSTVNSVSVSNSNRPVAAVKVYKPSGYAESLRSRYIENSKPKKQPGENVWEKLERELKERDEKIRLERLDAERSPSSES